MLQHHLAAEPHRWSLYFVSGTAEVTQVLYAIHAAALLAFAVGWHTRAAAVVAFVMHTSQFNRNELVRHAFDFLGGGLLFWSISLPVMGDLFSIDELRARLAPLGSPASDACVWVVGKPPSQRAEAPAARTVRVLSVGTIALLTVLFVG